MFYPIMSSSVLASDPPCDCLLFGMWKLLSCVRTSNNLDSYPAQNTQYTVYRQISSRRVSKTQGVQFSRLPVQYLSVYPWTGITSTNTLLLKCDSMMSYWTICSLCICSGWAFTCPMHGVLYLRRVHTVLDPWSFKMSS